MTDLAVRVGILTVSDRSYAGLRDDLSGPALAEQVRELGWELVWQDTLPDDRDLLAEFLKKQCDSQEIDLLLSTGGTGFARRDVTPEATQDVVEKNAPGLAEVIRAESLKITPHAMLARNTAGIRRKTLIVNLSGSPKAAREQFSFIQEALPHAVQLLREDPGAENEH
jgi:molybdenum cofactor synthesis domain-containing protein